MIRSPKVSIIIPTLNCKATLGKTITSVFSQSYSNYQLIIIDGGSTDGTVNIIKKYQKQIFFWQSRPDHGISDAFNQGLRKADGNYIYFMGGSDYLWNNQVLAKIVENVDIKNDMLICGRINRMSEDGQKVFYTSGLNLAKWHMLYKMDMPHQGLFTNRLYFKKYGLFDTKLNFAMDYDLLLRSYHNYPEIITKDLVVAAWRSGGVGTGKIDQVLAEYHLIRKRNHLAPGLLLLIIYWLSLFKYSIFDEK